MIRGDERGHLMPERTLVAEGIDFGQRCGPPQAGLRNKCRGETCVSRRASVFRGTRQRKGPGRSTKF